MEFDLIFMGKAFVGILPAVPTTLLITVLSIIVGITEAICIAYARYYRVPVLCRISAGYVSFFRGTPIVMHFFLVYYGLPHFIDMFAGFVGLGFRATDIPLKILAVVALSFSASSFFSEILRAGISAVAKGEIEAAYSLGMTQWQTMRHLILPQAFSFSIPNLGSRCIAILHGSSLAFWICVLEITAKANLIAADTYQFMEAFIAAAAIYWILTFIIERIVAVLEAWSMNALGRGLA